ncbi:MAG: radical SAM protein [Candidatus Omnitrophota bacterium]
MRFHFIRGNGHFARYIFDRFIWYWYPRLHIVKKFPEHVDIELTNQCNMKCPMCYSTLERFRKLPNGFMDFNLFKKIIDECAENGVFSIRLSIRGEPLIHPQIIDCIRYAKYKRIKEVSFLTNALSLDEHMSAEIIKAGLDWITVSFDGMGEIYNKIRKPADYEGALNRIRRFSEMKKSLGSIKPALKIQTVWQAVENNPSEFNEIFKNLADMISFNVFINYEVAFEHDPDFICPNPWQRFIIYWDGKVPKCINDVFELDIIGDINSSTIKEIWQGALMRRVRKDMLNKDRLKYPSCRKCSYGAKTEEMKVDIDGLKISTEMQKTDFNINKL